ncbi:hypothetical protein AYO49_05675 [Verrucomicrobiaceae bacterium SCGC AG-212-N21]|nr:hypothetical protein AYO49_05675 [Verrucomicrobiaceae bacterium SCGC AG-212-N21]
MSMPGNLQQVMTEIGPMLGIEEVVEYAKQSLWTLTIDTSTVVFAEYHESSRQLILSVDVTEMPTKRRPEIMDLLLRYNGSWDQTGGVCLSLDAEGRIVQQSAVLPAGDLDSQMLHTVVMNFLSTMGHWRLNILQHAEISRREAAREPAGDEHVPPPDFVMRI